MIIAGLCVWGFSFAGRHALPPELFQPAGVRRDLRTLKVLRSREALLGNLEERLQIAPYVRGCSAPASAFFADTEP